MMGRPQVRRARGASSGDADRQSRDLLLERRASTFSLESVSSFDLDITRGIEVRQWCKFLLCSLAASSSCLTNRQSTHCICAVSSPFNVFACVWIAALSTGRSFCLDLTANLPTILVRCQYCCVGGPALNCSLD